MNATSAGNIVDADAPSASNASASANVVVLLEDAALLDMLKQAVDGRRRIWRADDIVHAADLLLAAPYAVLLLDAAMTGHRTADLVGRLYKQFPDLPIIVSGRLDDEVELGPLISSGTVFRFLHKPVSLERARNFIEAAVRRLDETPVQRPEGGVMDLLPPMQVPAIRLPRIRLSPRLIRRGLRIGVVLLGIVLLGWGVAEVIERAPWQALDLSLPDKPAADQDRAAVQRLVGAAGIALAQGRLFEPEGRNAVELYRAVLARDPANVQARRGLTQVADQLLGAVERALLDGDLAAAANALDAARSADPEHPRLGFLSTQLAEDSHRARQGQAAVASGRPAAERAREQRVATLLAVADQRMKAGKLVGGLDSAEAYILEARQIAPDEAGVRQGLNALSATMLLSARQAWAEGNEPAARNWLQRAQALGVDPEGVGRFSAEMTSARLATMVEDRSRLLALANQRLAQGRLLLPATDSARHYLDLLRAADPAFAGIAETEFLLASRLLDEARRLSRAGRHGDSLRYIAAAEDAGAPRTELAATRAAVIDAGEAANAAQQVLPENALKKIAHTSPEYPARAAARGVEGWVDVEFTVTAGGTTRDAVVRDASPAGAFEDAVLSAVSRWRYEPRMVAGKAMDQRVQVRMRFKLADG